MKHKAYILLGSNLGDRSAQIAEARRRVEKWVAIDRSSAVYKTEPWHMDTEDWFFNQVLEVSTDLSAHELLEHILEIEQDMGRTREHASDDHYSSRTIDLDILYFDDAIIDDPDLTVPHPRIQERRFALAPMVELNPSHEHPVLKRSQFELLKICPDQSFLELV